jgi:hypothetical protein
MASDLKAEQRMSDDDVLAQITTFVSYTHLSTFVKCETEQP